MQPNVLVVLIYALVVLAGGLFGFFKANSAPSLVAGTLFAFALIASSIGLSKGKKWGYLAALSSVLILIGFFACRFYSTYTWFPSGIMLIVSLVIAVYLFLDRR